MVNKENNNSIFLSIFLMISSFGEQLTKDVIANRKIPAGMISLYNGRINPRISSE